MLAQTAIPSLGFDTATRIKPETARAFKLQGYSWVARYLHRSQVVDGLGSTLGADELNNILGAGLALIPIQLGKSSLEPSAGEGTRIGEAAAANAHELGIPTGTTLWCDVEWKPEHMPSDPAATIAYIESWAAAVKQAGFGAGLYVGPNIGLDGTQLYMLSGITHYWKSASKVPWVEKRGYQIIQSRNFEANGIKIDADVIAYDNKGDRPKWVVAG